MKLEVRNYDLDTSEPTVLLHEDDCRSLSVSEGDRVRIAGTSAAIAIVSVSDTLVRCGTILVPPSVQRASGTAVGGSAEVTLSHTPESVRHIRAKMDGMHLPSESIRQVVDDVVAGRLSRIEISAWLTALYIKGMDTDEIAAYARAMAETGDELTFHDKQVFDFHSFGGLPGNKITPIVVSIVAAAGLTIPKLSSRAISSACGTADFVETFCRVDLDADEVRRISEETGGVFSWTGATDLGPAGDHFITVQRPLEDAKAYARDLMDLGDKLGIRVECAITYAKQPLGEAVGPILEARECMEVLERVPGHEDVIDKACICAGTILSMGGVRDGVGKAREILESGLAHEKFLEIVAAQGGKPDISSKDMVPGSHSAEIRAERSGFVRSLSNKAVVAVAKAAGAPSDKGAGVVLGKKLGMKVSEGDVLMTIYAEREDKLGHAVDVALEREPIGIEGMVIKRIGPD